MNNQVSKNQTKSFGVLMGFVFVGISFLFVDKGSVSHLMLLVTSAVCFGLVLVFPTALYWPYKIWMQIGHILAALNSHIVLFVMFFFLLTPLALLFRIVGRDFLQMHVHGDRVQSFWKIRQAKTTDMSRQF